jgi:hypothetical protein
LSLAFRGLPEMLTGRSNDVAAPTSHAHKVGAVTSIVAHAGAPGRLDISKSDL